MTRALPWLFLAVAITGCGASRSAQTAAPPPAGTRTPEGCGRDYPANAPLLTLKPTREPNEKTQKSQPFQFAIPIKVHAELSGEGLWTDFNDGWSMLALRFASADAKSLALHLAQLTLPPRTQIWLCSADGRFKQGPYREAVGGELWTPVVMGEEARLQIDVPTAAKHELRGEVAEAFGGFR